MVGLYCVVQLTQFKYTGIIFLCQIFTLIRLIICNFDITRENTQKWGHDKVSGIYFIFCQKQPDRKDNAIFERGMLCLGREN